MTVFGMIAFAVLGGMAWATRATFALAKQNIIDEYERRLDGAVRQMDSALTGILYHETSRPYKDYRALRMDSPVAVWRRGGIELDADYVVLASPLLTSDPEQAWIDLYYQVSADGDMSSPQVNDEAALRAIENLRVSAGNWPRARATMEWLKSVLPGIDITSRVREAMRGYRGPCIDSGGTEPACPESAVTVAADAQSALSPEYAQRKKVLRDTQVSYVPKPACVDDHEADVNVRTTASFSRAPQPASESVQDGGVQITTDPLVTFWLPPTPDGDLKLTFVRECHADADVFYQGFVADWGRLETAMIGTVGEWPDGATLMPILEPVPNLSETTRYHCSNIPARLDAPAVPHDAGATAWAEVRATLIGSWATAGVVLMIAGVGIRNLVALTERRMNFAYAVTHELRTPLTTFRLYTDMLTAGLVPEEKRQNYLETLNRESFRLGSLVEDVLEYARLENHRVRLNPTKTDGPALLALIGETLQKRCADNGIDARSENAMLNGRAIETDVDIVNRIATVLINNACRHARYGMNGSAVVVRVSDGDGVVHLDVIDTGPGVERGDARAIFKPFRRGRGADAAAHGGIGLGLALARNWAQLLGGHLDLATRHHPQYGGAHFRLTIPTSHPA
jgi:signal transduction histidine kinase